MSHYAAASSLDAGLSLSSVLPISDLNAAGVVLNNNPSSGVLSSDNEEDEFDDNILFDFDQDAHIVNPLDAAIDQLEDRLIAILDEFKLVPHAKPEDLVTMLRPALEIGAHLGPSMARKHYASSDTNDVDEAVKQVYEHLNVHLLFPVMLEVAQSDATPVKRAAALQFFHNLHKECQRPGSYLDRGGGATAGPTGDGKVGSETQQQPPTSSLAQQRNQLKHMREVELLRHWIDAATQNISVESIFTSQALEDSIASRAILSANAALRPAFRWIAQSIAVADDTGAMNLYLPVFHMSLGVVSRLFLLGHNNNVDPADNNTGADSVRASCIKFLETLVLLCTSKGPRQTQRQSQQRKGFVGSTPEDFCLEDIPTGHPTITRETLDSIGEFAFTALRGMIMIGGQCKIDTSLIPPPESMISPFNRLLSIVKLAALAFLEIESSLIDEEGIRNAQVMSSLELDFVLCQKSYSVAINGICAVAMNRPGCFKYAAMTLAQRTMNPPVFFSTPASAEEGGTHIPTHTSTNLTRAGVMAITSQLKASCLTLLRNPLSVSVGDVHEWLHKALVQSDMAIQAEKALSMAKQQAALRTAGRAVRNRAALFYEWDQSEADKQTKRQRETDDALAKLRAAKVARGLGHGIHLPVSMVDACELILANLKHLPDHRPTGASSTGRRQHTFTWEFLVDAILSNGASLSTDATRWYDRDGGAAWNMDLQDGMKCDLDSKIVHVIEEEVEEDMDVLKKGESTSKSKDRQLYQDQCLLAASDAFGRIVNSTQLSKSKALVKLGNQIAARLAFTLASVEPPQRSEMKESQKFAKGSIPPHGEVDFSSANSFMDKFPLVSSCLAFDATREHLVDVPISYSLSNRLLFEAYSRCCDGDAEMSKLEYDQSLDIFVSLISKLCQLGLEKPNDADLRKVSLRTSSNLPLHLSILPALTTATPVVMSYLCDIEPAYKAVADAQRKGSRHNLAASAAAHAAKAAAEKRATGALLGLRDIAFQRHGDVRRNAVQCAVAIASGRLPAPNDIEEKALKLVMNVLYSRSKDLADTVVKSATDELVNVTEFAIENQIPAAAAIPNLDPLEPSNEQEKMVMNRARKPIVLYLALCVRQPELIECLLNNASRSPSLSKVVRSNMPKLAKAVATKYGAADIALKVANMVDENGTSLLLAFLDNLSHDVTQTQDDFVAACSMIQDQKVDNSGKKDPRFIIPAVAITKRAELVDRLPEFIGASDAVFKAALAKMSERVGRQSLSFRDETESSIPVGMTLCEQLVFLHSVDFAAAGIPQKRYLDAIRLCLDDEEVYTDRVVMSALERISLDFIKSRQGLPLAYMRTIILTCSKHDTLHPWICQVLLPRLVEGEIYNDRRQWEGWMRCAKMLERTSPSGVSSIDAINKLPEEQLKLYRSKYPS